MKLSKNLSKPLIIASIVLLAAALLPVSLLADEKPVRKIVVFETWFTNEAAKDKLVEHAGGVKVKNLDLIDGMAVYLPEKAASALARQAGVLRVDDDVEVHALRHLSSPQPAETLPWGVVKVGANQVWGTTVGAGVKVAIVDTGIELTHPDLAANVKGGYNAINPSKSANDDNGHGTHVAGTVAAVDNTIGVVGVAPQVSLYAVKVLDRRGSGWLSDIIEGLDWAVASGMQVVNMSLGTSSNVASFHDAVKRTYAAGVLVVAAAGNDYGGPVIYPAAYPEVVAVSATNSSDVLAGFSSVGPEVDLSAPGASVPSTYKGSTYKTLSGTSMASPHVAGVAALVLTTVPGVYDLDGDGWDPSEVQSKLEATAKDLGAVGKDPLYGAGRVDAVAAVLQ